jgi:uncharacterized protein (TIGR03382 family)
MWGIWLTAAHPGATDAALRAVREDHVAYEVAREVPWAGGTTVILRPVVGGEPVEGALRVVSLGVHGEVRRVRGPVVRPELLPDGAWTSDAAIDRARLVVHGLLGTGDELYAPSIERVAYADRDGKVHPTWAIDLSNGAGRSYRVLVDRRTGDVVQLRPTSWDARANVYDTNPVSSTLTEVDLPRLTDPNTLSGEQAWVQSCEDFRGTTCRAIAPHALPDANGDYLFDPDPTSMVDPLAEVQMYYQLDKVAIWFQDHVGYVQAEPMQGIVNFELENAFYGDADGDGIGEVAFGQDAIIDFAYDGDVVYHEFTHSVIGTVTELGLFGADEYGIDFAPMGLNEGSADLFSMAITQDPRLGEYSGQGFGLPEIRNLDPDRRCPDDLYGEGHEDGMIWGAVGWNMIDDPQIGAEVVADLVYGAVTTWGSDTNWAIAGQSLLDSADDLLAAGAIDQATHDAIVGHVQDGGLPGCERVIPLDEGKVSTQFAIYAGLADALGAIPLTAQFSLTPDAETTALRLSIDDWFVTNPGHAWTIYVRRGDHIVHDVQSVLGLPFPVPSVYDFSVDGTGTYTLELGPDGDYPFEPGETYYFSIASRSDGTMGPLDLSIGEVTVSGERVQGGPTGTTTTPPTDTTTTGPTDGGADTSPDATDDKGGCGCASGGPGSAAGLLLALLVARRRR